MKKLYFSLSLMAVLMCSCSKPADELRYDNLVDMQIGTGGHGHVFVGASVPFGMVQLGPTSIPQSWDWCSGYHSSDSTVIGFSHTHLSGTGIGDLFDITVMPVVGEVSTYARGNDSIQESGMWSYADRSKEVAVPGYYSVPLERYNVNVELTATNRVGFHRYTFPQSDSSAIVFDLQNGGCWDKATETHIEVETPNVVSGYRYSKGWAKNQKVYFVAEFSKPMRDFTLHGENSMYGRVHFATADGEKILMKVAISPVSVEGAKKNLAAELPGWDFETVRQTAADQWNKELSSVKIEAADKDVVKTFYTSLYHLMISPVTFADVDSLYTGADGAVYKAKDFVPYTIFSLWDTYRAAMPLMSIIQPQRYGDMVNSMIDICDKQGSLPVWHLWGNETNCMVGKPGAIIVADAIVKQAKGVDAEKAFESLLKSAADTTRGCGLRAKYGFIPADLFRRAVACDMEYAIADGAISLAAKYLGKDELADSFATLSHSYRNYFDPTTRYMRGRLADGSWRTPFDPVISIHEQHDYCEGNAWQYTWLAPHDVEGLKDCFGSRENIVAKLDSLFTADSQLNAEASPDITGMIGQYAHGNEPSHHITYMYAMLEEPHKTADLVRQVLSEMYSATEDGLCGNEDAGQMSAWYVLSSMGFYQVESGSGRYWFGSPIVDKAEITVPAGTFKIVVKNNSTQNKYINRVTLNGEEYTLPYITHNDIMAGGEMTIEMSDK